MKIGIAGAGGIGSNVAFHLVRSGELDLKIFDFDKVEPGNISRQFYFADQIGALKVEALKANLLRINPAATIEISPQRLDTDNITGAFQDCDIVVEAFDQAETKAMLLNGLGASGKFIVSGCGLAGLSAEGVKIKKLGENIVVVGDFASDMERFRLYSPKVLMVASLMALMVLKKLGYPDER